MTVWTTRGLVRQVAVGPGYRGCIAGTQLGIGSTIGELEAVLGAIVEDEADNLVLKGLDGIAFESTRWVGAAVAENRTALITSIFVFRGRVD